MGVFLVTGGAGFIGSGVAERLIAEGNEVVIIDNLSTGYRSNIPEGVQFIEGDCQDPQIYAELMGRKFDAILHIAGQSSGEVSFDDPVYDLRSNTESTLRIINYGLETGCNRIIYASTVTVYEEESNRPRKESEPLKALSFYGVGKIASENYLEIYRSLGLKTTALRLFNVYGPGQNLKNMRQGMISIYMSQMLDNGSVLVKGSLDRFRDHVFIDDVVDAFMLCLNNDFTVNEVFNVGTGVKTSVGDLLNIMREVYGKNVPIDVEGNTPGDSFGKYADVEYFSKKAGFKASVGLREGLARMFKWAEEEKKSEVE